LDNPEISYQVELNVNPSDIFFLKKGIETLYFIFDITAENTKLGQFARASRAKLLSRSIKQVKEMVKDEIKLKADIKLKSPNIIIPFDQQKLLETEVWVVSPGDLKIYTDGSSPDASKDHYDSIFINMNHVGIESISSYKNWLANQPVRAIKVVEHFTVDVLLKNIKKSYLDVTWHLNRPNSYVDIKINDLVLNMTKRVYSQVFQLPNVLIPVMQDLDNIIFEKKEILLASKKISQIRIGNDYKIYRKSLMVLSEGRLYFFTDRKDPKLLDHSILNYDQEFVKVREYQVHVADSKNNKPRTLKLFSLKKIYSATIYLQFSSEQS
jgi:hypothetical protein